MPTTTITGTVLETSDPGSPMLGAGKVVALPQDQSGNPLPKESRLAPISATIASGSVSLSLPDAPSSVRWLIMVSPAAGTLRPYALASVAPGGTVTTATLRSSRKGGAMLPDAASVEALLASLPVDDARGGSVDIEALTETLSDSFVPAAPAGGFTLYATDDPAVADAHPEFAWVILGESDPDPDPDPDWPTFATAVAADDFNRANAENNLGSTSTGSLPWTSFGFRANIDGNRAQLVGANAPSFAGATIDTSSASHRVSAKLGTQPSDINTGTWTGVIARHDAGTGFDVTLIARGDGYRLLARDGNLDGNGDFISIASLTAGTPAVGDVMALEAHGTHYKAFINGTLVGEGDYTGAINAAATRGGILGRSSSFAGYVDDFEARTP